MLFDRLGCVLCICPIYLGRVRKYLKVNIKRIGRYSWHMFDCCVMMMFGFVGVEDLSCQNIFIVIRDDVNVSSTTATLCSGDTRRTVYESTGHVVEIRLIGSRTGLASSGLLFRFEGNYDDAGIDTL